MPPKAPHPPHQPPKSSSSWLPTFICGRTHNLVKEGGVCRVGRDVEAPTYNDAVNAQLAEVSAQKKYHNFTELLETNDIWEVK